MSEVKILTAILEYDPNANRIFVRGVFSDAKLAPKEPIQKENKVNYVSVFENVDMGKHVGFTFT